MLYGAGCRVDDVTEPDAVKVECYSGHTYAQEPRTVVWQGRHYPVVRVEQRWRTPEGPAFRVQVEAEGAFELHYDELEDRWSLAQVSELWREEPTVDTDARDDYAG
jgi:hypothetical protein